MFIFCSSPSVVPVHCWHGWHHTRRRWHCIPFPLQEMFTQMVVNPKMLRFRSITFQVLMTSYQVIFPFSRFFFTIFDYFLLDGKSSCYGDVLPATRDPRRLDNLLCDVGWCLEELSATAQSFSYEFGGRYLLL